MEQPAKKKKWSELISFMHFVYCLCRCAWATGFFSQTFCIAHSSPTGPDKPYIINKIMAKEEMKSTSKVIIFLSEWTLFLLQNLSQLVKG